MTLSLPDRWLIVGLGNPGPQYAGTRHNLGFLAVEALAARWGIALSRRKFEALYGQGWLGPRRVILAQPQTYMNLSGRAVGPLARYFQLPPQAVVVIHDDLDVPAGRLKLAWDGGAGGHRGVLSVAEGLGTLDFYRVKGGVGRPPAGMRAEEFVLMPLAAPEVRLLTELAQRAAEAVEVLLTAGLAAAQNRYHGMGPVGGSETPGQTAAAQAQGERS